MVEQKMVEEGLKILSVPSTPLEINRSLPADILDEIVVGGFVFQRFTELRDRTMDLSSNSELCLFDSESLLLYAWQELNTGKWTDVNVSWHKLYAAVSWLKAVSLYRVRATDASVWTELIKVCDMGHLMGGDVWNDILLRTISAIEEKTIRKDSFQPGAKKLKVTPTFCHVHCPIPEVILPSLTEFSSCYIREKKPVVLKNSIDFWPALKKWSPEYIRTVCGTRTVPVELGRRYTDEDWGQELMTVGDFIDKYLYMLDNPTMKIAYLAQHDLLTQVPSLRDDISPPDYIAFSGDHDPDMNAWFGPEGTVSPLHYDQKHNILCQVFGEKYVRLYEESQTENIYPHPSGMLANTSQVDVENPNFEKFPKFENASFCDYILRPGDSLYIPPRCWHYVRSLSVSFSVSFWFRNDRADVPMAEKPDFADT